ncbi:MAG: hypothetical protein NT154_47420 [Verrucomicrobia bacterium]|nr:hypothetical protein [Verrucomicrobiota bacterium]
MNLPLAARGAVRARFRARRPWASQAALRTAKPVVMSNTSQIMKRRNPSGGARKPMPRATNQPHRSAVTYASTSSTTPPYTDGKAYDRILASDAIAKGLNRLKLERVVIQPHRHGKGAERRLYTDHFPVTATIRLER